MTANRGDPTLGEGARMTANRGDTTLGAGARG